MQKLMMSPQEAASETDDANSRPRRATPAARRARRRRHLHIVAKSSAVQLPARARGPAPELLANARLEGAQLALRTIRHVVSGRLTVVVGNSELLADDPRLPPDLRARAAKIATSAMTAAEVLRTLDDRLVDIHLDPCVAGPTVLDVDRSMAQS
jgi:hypothetical protein